MNNNLILFTVVFILLLFLSCEISTIVQGVIYDDQKVPLEDVKIFVSMDDRIREYYGEAIVDSIHSDLRDSINLKNDIEPTSHILNVDHHYVSYEPYQTDDEGKFVIHFFEGVIFVPPKVEIIFKKPGYKTEKVNVEWSSDTVRLNVTLEKQN